MTRRTTENPRGHPWGISSTHEVREVRVRIYYRALCWQEAEVPDMDIRTLADAIEGGDPADVDWSDYDIVNVELMADD